MAPELKSKTCTNCRHRHTKSTFQRCVDCIDKSSKENQFPGWEPDEEVNQC
ncbi:MAG: hypothetical protein WA003_08595 [Desulfuromonadaceae bacterium]